MSASAPAAAEGGVAVKPNIWKAKEEEDLEDPPEWIFDFPNLEPQDRVQEEVHRLQPSFEATGIYPVYTDSRASRVHLAFVVRAKDVAVEVQNPELNSNIAAAAAAAAGGEGGEAPDESQNLDLTTNTAAVASFTAAGEAVEAQNLDLTAAIASFTAGEEGAEAVEAQNIDLTAEVASFTVDVGGGEAVEAQNLDFTAAVASPTAAGEGAETVDEFQNPVFTSNTAGAASPTAGAASPTATSDCRYFLVGSVEALEPQFLRAANFKARIAQVGFAEAAKESDDQQRAEADQVLASLGYQKSNKMGWEDTTTLKKCHSNLRSFGVFRLLIKVDGKKAKTGVYAASVSDIPRAFHEAAALLEAAQQALSEKKGARARGYVHLYRIKLEALFNEQAARREQETGEPATGRKRRTTAGGARAQGTANEARQKRQKKQEQGEQQEQQQQQEQPEEDQPKVPMGDGPGTGLEAEGEAVPQYDLPPDAETGLCDVQDQPPEDGGMPVIHPFIHQG
uniref:Uncharacterized protein n=1 Tax=Chromera velia CCMP2878 TaxID=1169474 RepID=A0A0G4IC73_9ALVE|eukprot:Cvel_12956.t1-p1 / transcript=Cvel_12956.t1 / gene=Cvel_12956 / organism=Chromera_velia_CCMP2878 / gene_product=hypothetical protein / transcript_product=hypothetical protein / location=Cvel_scaffold867:20705-23487(+) / protein_length=507 / sequence_SO=supercontig / SO=protein_coding / is_pseudo=false